jgi:transposase
MRAAIRLVEDPFYQRLVNDLERGTRHRKINYAKYRWVLEVAKMPQTVPEHWRTEITQPMLNRAHKMAQTIMSALHGPQLSYDSLEKPMRLQGCYGTNQ